MNVNVPMNTADFARLIQTIVKRGAQVHDFIQRAAVAAVLFSLNDRNVEPARQLIKSMPVGQRKDALVAYLEQHGNLVWKKADKTFDFTDAVAAGKVQPKTADELYAIKWDTAKKETPPTSIYDAEEEVDRLISRLQKLAKTAHVENKELINRIALVKARWVSERAGMVESNEQKLGAAE